MEPTPPPADPLAPVRAAIFAGDKIQAIRLYRTGVNAHVGLAEAKKLVEKATAELYAKQPEKFSQPPTKAGAGCSAVLAAILAIPILVWYHVTR